MPTLTYSGAARGLCGDFGGAAASPTVAEAAARWTPSDGAPVFGGGCGGYDGSNWGGISSAGGVGNASAAAAACDGLAGDLYDGCVFDVNATGDAALAAAADNAHDLLVCFSRAVHSHNTCAHARILLLVACDRTCPAAAASSQAAAFVEATSPMLYMAPPASAVALAGMLTTVSLGVGAVAGGGALLDVSRVVCTVASSTAPSALSVGSGSVSVRAPGGAGGDGGALLLLPPVSAAGRSVRLGVLCEHAAYGARYSEINVTITAG